MQSSEEGVPLVLEGTEGDLQGKVHVLDDEVVDHLEVGLHGRGLEELLEGH